MNVSLTPELEDFINARVATGRYRSASEVVREALRLLEDQDQVRAMRLAELRSEIRKGADQLDRGEGTTYDDASLKAFFDSIKRTGPFKDSVESE